VTYYITADSIDQTLAFVSAHSGQGSSIIFDYTHPAVVAGSSDRREGNAWRRVVKNFGEPLRFGLHAEAVENFLSQRGFHHIKNATYPALRETYLTGPNQRRSLTSIFGIIHAEVKE
jgi:O-methyltransferase involved in polyketide biosynthesis